jgi:glycosyltransferase involved in cell wall biosynthesis
MASKKSIAQRYKLFYQVNRQNYILWLPSWYPNEQEPTNGDFIQRHARAASLHNSIVVIFFTQYGEKIISDYKRVEQTSGNLKEIIVYVPFKPSRFKILDRVVYNISFYRFSKKFLLNYFNDNGFPSLVHVHVPVKSGNLALWAKKRFGIPYIASEHASTYIKEASNNFFKRHWFYRYQVKKIFSEATVVTNVSNTITRILKQLFPIKRSMIIHNVVDTSLFNLSNQKKDIFTFIHVSGLNDQKNIFGILRAFKKLSEIRKDWKFIIVGPYTKEIEQFIVNEQLDQLICLAGEVLYADVAGYMQKAHVMVLFSKHENFPCVIIEALCCGLPVISSDVGGINETVNNSNGILVESENEKELVVQLIKIRDTYHNYDTKQIAADATQKFNYWVISKQFDELYRIAPGLNSKESFQ